MELALVTGKIENKTSTKTKKKTLSDGFRASRHIVFHVGEFLGRLLYKTKKSF